MNIEEYKTRYAAQLVERTGISPHNAAECFNAVDFADLSDGFEDDPEGAADEEISYWDS